MTRNTGAARGACVPSRHRKHAKGEDVPTDVIAWKEKPCKPRRADETMRGIPRAFSAFSARRRCPRSSFWIEMVSITQVSVPSLRRERLSKLTVFNSPFNNRDCAVLPFSPVFRRRDGLKAGAHQLLRRVTQNSCETLIALQNPAVKRGVQDAAGRLLERGTIQRFVCSKRLVSPRMLCSVSGQRWRTRLRGWRESAPPFGSHAQFLFCVGGHAVSPNRVRCYPESLPPRRMESSCAFQTEKAAASP
jgi:hypothetical protein